MEYDILIDNIFDNINTMEKANFHYNLFREYKDQAVFYDDDFKNIKKHQVLLQMCEELGVMYYQEAYLMKILGIKMPRFMNEPNQIIFMFYKNIADKYLSMLRGKPSHVTDWYVIDSIK